MEAKAIRTDAEYRRLADDELAQAQHDEWVRAKVAAARADKRPGMSTLQMRPWQACSRHLVPKNMVANSR